MYKMDGMAFFLLLLGGILLFILLCACGVKMCMRSVDPMNRLGRAYRTDFTGV